MKMGYENKWNDAYGIDKDPIRKYLIYPFIRDLDYSFADKVILDLGCGNGNLIYSMLDQPFKKAIGIDISKDFLSKANQYINDLRVTFFQGDITQNLPYKEGAFDIAYSIFVFNEITPLSPTVKQVARVLKTDGLFLLIMTHPFFPLNYYLYEKFTGLKNEKIKNVKGYFEKYQAEYMFSLAKVGARYFHQTLEEIINPLIKNGLQILKIHELTVNKEIMNRYPVYAGGDDIPRFIVVQSQKT
jgi:ubiquinone/menaquinone biosynthesis C-methylase UbiE